MQGSPALAIVGLPQLRKDLRAFAPDALRELRAELKAAAGPIAQDASRNAPVGDPSRDPHAGQLAANVRAGGTATGAYIADRELYAAVQEFGGTIAPRGTPISIDEHRYMRDAIDAHTSRLADDIDRRLTRLAQRHGWA